MRENGRGVNLRYSVSTYVNFTMYPPVQLLYANTNKILKVKQITKKEQIQCWCPLHRTT
jgi:hypothetical protein